MHSTMSEQKLIPVSRVNDYYDTMNAIIARHLTEWPRSISSGLPTEVAPIVKNIMGGVCGEALADCRRIIQDARNELLLSAKMESMKC